MDKHCIDCKYYQGHSVPAFTCCYIFIEDKKRPCDPGKDCMVKVKRKQERTWMYKHLSTKETF